MSGDISKLGKQSGVTHNFFFTPVANGAFTIYIKEVDGEKQVWGHTIGTVSGRSKPIDEDLYLCPITPPASVFYGKMNKPSTNSFCNIQKEYMSLFMSPDVDDLGSVSFCGHVT